MNIGTETLEHCPEAILDWIAFYPDTLSEVQRGAVEAHAASCAACRNEIDVLAGHVRPTEIPDAEELFSRVLARMESEQVPMQQTAAGLDFAPARIGAGNGAPQRAPRARRPLWKRPVVLAAGVAMMLMGAGLGSFAAEFLSGNLAGFAESVYLPAVGGESAAPIEAQPSLDVVFRSDASIEKINASLRAIGGVIESGPSQVGRYRLRLPVGADLDAAASLLRAEGTGVASFAQAAVQ